MHTPNIAILLANGSHARLLRRDHETGEFHTDLTLEDGPHGLSLGPGVAGPDQRVQRRRVQAFLEVIAEHLRQTAQAHPLKGLVVVAPARILGDLSAALDPVCPVLARVQKDLVKAKDHDLAGLLAHALLQAEGARPISA